MTEYRISKLEMQRRDDARRAKANRALDCAQIDCDDLDDLLTRDTDELSAAIDMREMQTRYAIAHSDYSQY